MAGIIIALWKKKNHYEAYTSVSGFCDYHPAFKNQEIWASFRKQDKFETEDLVIFKTLVFKRLPKKG